MEGATYRKTALCWPFFVVQGYISISKQRLFCKGKRGKAEEFIYSTASVAYITHHIVPSFSSRLMLKQAD